MTFYPATTNPYRASTGSMPLRIPQSPNRSKFEETCDSCGSSYTDEHLLQFNTPFSGTPNASAGSLHPTVPHTHRSRRTSGAGIEPGKVLTRYHNGALVLEPATSSYSTHGGERRRRSSVSAAPPPDVPRSHVGRSWAQYHQEIDITEGNPTQRGTTRFPRKLVNKDACKQANLPFEEGRDGTIIVLRALPRGEIEHLVELTESIRARRHHSHSHKHVEKHVEKHVRIITSPTETIEHPEASRRHRRDSHSGPVPQIIHHYVEDPRHSSHRLSRAEDEAAAAASSARRKEYRAEVSGSWLDGRRAAKARQEADEKARVVDDIARRERRNKEVIVVR